MSLKEDLQKQVKDSAVFRQGELKLLRKLVKKMSKVEDDDPERFYMLYSLAAKIAGTANEIQESVLRSNTIEKIIRKL
jgi:hypothetical protein